jgi:hypothetical protein
VVARSSCRCRGISSYPEPGVPGCRVWRSVRRRERWMSMSLPSQSVLCVHPRMWVKAAERITADAVIRAGQRHWTFRHSSASPCHWRPVPATRFSLNRSTVGVG